MADEFTPSPEIQSPIASPVTELPAAQPAEPVNVLDSDGQLVSIPGDRLHEALSSGQFTSATQADIDHYEKQEKYGTLGQQLMTGLEGAASAATFGASTGIEQGLGVDQEDIQNRREVNPGVHMIGQGAGLVGSSFLVPGAGAAGLLERVGAGAAEAAGLGAAKGFLQKIGSSAVKGAAENAIFQAQDEASKLLSGDPNQHVQTAVADVGLSGLIGAGIGGGIGTVSPLWQAAKASKLGGVLGAITKKLGGVEGEAIDTPAVQALKDSGMEVSPFIRASIEQDQPMQQIMGELASSGEGASKAEAQQAVKDFQINAGDTMSSALGRSADEVRGMDLSPYESGKKLGNSIADEFNKNQGPLAKEYEALEARTSSTELTPDKIVKHPVDYSNPYMPKEIPSEVVPGTATQISEKIAQLQQNMNGTSLLADDISSVFNKVQKGLPQVKNLGQLKDFISKVGDLTNADPLNNPLKRAGQQIISVLRDAHEDLVLEKLGKDAPELVARMNIARKAYRAQAELKDYLDGNLKIGGSVNSFAKNLREMAKVDGEGVLRRLSGKGDADMLRFMQEHFPGSAEVLKQYHRDSLLQGAAAKASEGHTLNPKNLSDRIAAMSPELRDFAISKEAQARLGAIDQVLGHVNGLVKAGGVSSDTILNKILSKGGASALGVISAIAGHGTAGLVAGLFGKLLMKDAPDAAKLALLKWMGSTKPISAEGFQAMVSTIQHGIKGQELVNGAVKNLFKAGKDVLPQYAIPSESSLKALDKSLLDIQTNPNSMLNVGNKAAYYLPDHGTAAASTAMQASNYVNSQRPDVSPQAPLDSKQKPNPVQAAAFKRTLTIAQQPLVVLDKIAKGSLTPKDVIDMRSMYPALYRGVSEKLTEHITNEVSNGTIIPYKQRMAMSMFKMQPLDSTMSPAGIQGAQPTPKLDQQPENKGGQNEKSALNKLAANYQTANQEREARSQREH